jgi:hypothetical protein
LTEIVNDVEASDLMYRVRRSAAEIYYGRARDAAAREGIITEAVQALEQDLREAALQASEEGQRSPDERSASDRLLADVADLRRRVEQRERLRAAAGESQQSSQRASQEASEQQGSESGESQRSSNQEGSRPGERQGSASANTGDRALSAWDPNLANRPLPNARNQGQDSIGRQSEAIADRASRMAERASSRELTDAELASLRQMARELRQLAGDPLAAETASMKRAVSQIELAALAAVSNRMRSESARSSVPVGESAEYREAVAEYYRRLGGS